MKNSKKNDKKKRRRRFVFFGFTSVVIIIFVLITVGKCWVEIYQKYEEKQLLENKLLSLKEDEERLKVDALKLQDPEYVARYAREKYLYSKDGELIIRMPDY